MTAADTYAQDFVEEVRQDVETSINQNNNAPAGNESAENPDEVVSRARRLLQDRPENPRKPFLMNKKSFELKLRLRAMKQILETSDRATQKRVLQYLQESFNEMPKKIQLPFDNNDMNVALAFERLAEIIIRFDEVLLTRDNSPENTSTVMYSESRMTALQERFLSALSECKEAILEAIEKQRSNRSKGFWGGLGAGVIAYFAYPVAVPFAVGFGIASAASFGFGVSAAKKKWEAELVEAEVTQLEDEVKKKIGNSTSTNTGSSSPSNRT
eukprot:TRINITY_DN9118_c0_g1_i1.p1 TRINITY_DN9118_c0_g1~~TRINITY_DN9118_c0_g1_i1.p1  ORF type:complete len:270 (-),score=63.06 TRINITY_DN9118_c0_g1_i1:308-1117(-)